MQVVDLQNNRLWYLQKKSIIESEHPDTRIMIGNFGYIVVSSDLESKVIKYFGERIFYEKEIANYALLKKSGILVPAISPVGIGVIGSMRLYKLEIENIRAKYPRFKDMQSIDPQKLGDLLSLIHAISFNAGNAYLHGNLHPSNFFSIRLEVYEYLTWFPCFIEI